MNERMIRKQALLLVAVVVVLAAACSIAQAEVPFVNIENFADVSDWQQGYFANGGSIGTNGDVATIQTNGSGNTQSFQKIGLSLPTSPYSKFEIKIRRSPICGTRQVSVYVNYGSSLGYSYIPTGSTTLDNDDWQTYSVTLGAGTLDYLQISISDPATSGQPVGVEVDFAVLALPTEPLYADDPAIPEPLIEISNVHVTNVTPTSATVTWTTDVACNSTLDWGTTSAYGQTPVTGGTNTTNHSATLTGLSAYTPYFYRINVSQTGYTANTREGTFFTAADPSTEWLYVDDMAAIGEWTLEAATLFSSDGDVATMSRDCLGGSGTGNVAKAGLGIRLADFPILQVKMRKPAAMANYNVSWDVYLTDAEGVPIGNIGWHAANADWTTHRIDLSPLFQYWGSDRTVGKFTLAFTSNAPNGTPTDLETDFALFSRNTAPTYVNDPDAVIPTLGISNVQVTRTQDSATITWETDAPCDSTFDWGPTDAYGQTPMVGGTNTKSHSVTLTGLGTHTQYFYRINVSAVGYESNSKRGTFFTKADVLTQWLLVDDMADVSEWSLEGGTSFVSDGDVGTISSDCLGGSWHGTGTKTGLGITLSDFPILQMKMRKPASMAAYNVSVDVYLWDISGEFIGNVGWVAVNSDWTTHRLDLSSLFQYWGNDRTVGEFMLVIWSNAPSGTPTVLDTDFIAFMRELAATYEDDPVQMPKQFGISIGEAKHLPTGTDFTLGVGPSKGKIVTCTVGNDFYLEEEDRSAGVRVLWNEQRMPGDEVSSLDGVVSGASNKEKVFVVNSITFGDTPVETPKPLGINNRAADSSQGLLVKAYGKVTFVGTDMNFNSFFAIDDGTGFWGGEDPWTPGLQIAGIRVLNTDAFPYPSVGDYVSVVGVMCPDYTFGYLVRQLVTRNAFDVTIINDVP